MARKNGPLARSLITALNASKLRTECPVCSEQFMLRDAELFHLNEFSPAGVKRLEQLKADIAARRNELKERGAKTEADSRVRAGAINLGRILERLASVNGRIRYPHEECRPLFDPIDYLVFEGIGTGEVYRIVLLELKSGGSRLNDNQKSVKQAIDAGKIAFNTYAVKAGGEV